MLQPSLLLTTKDCFQIQCMLKAGLGLLLVHGSTELEEKSEQFLFLYSNFPFSLDNPSRKKWLPQYWTWYPQNAGLWLSNCLGKQFYLHFWRHRQRSGCLPLTHHNILLYLAQQHCILLSHCVWSGLNSSYSGVLLKRTFPNQHQMFVRAVFKWVSKVMLYLLWSCFTMLSDWLKKLVPLSQPIRNKTKTNLDLHAFSCPGH